jgi:hypothetical protein
MVEILVTLPSGHQEKMSLKQALALQKELATLAPTSLFTPHPRSAITSPPYVGDVKVESHWKGEKG